ncbi:MAG: hypothetical protein IKV98_10210 [Clostridia bacterium]|nr:hypothetical protein [Clostridia bacterium]
MDDQLSEKLKSILADPDSLKSILSIASAFGSVNNNKSTSSSDASEKSPAALDTQERVNEEKPSDAVVEPSVNAMQMVSAFGNKANNVDDRVNLLLSIKPFLSERKRQRVDSIVKALGAARLLSSYKDLDFLTKLGL